MTASLLALDDEEGPIDWAIAESGPVVVHPLRLKRPDRPNSYFNDPSWSLTPMGLNPGSSPTLRWVPGSRDQDFPYPSHLIPSFKRIVWLMINRPAPDAYLAGRNSRRWPAAGSIHSRFRALRRFANFLGQQQVARLSDVSDDLLDTYASLLFADGARSSNIAKAQDLGYVAAIAFRADFLPEADRMIEPSWSARPVGVWRKGADNSKEVINPDTFAPLVWWAQRIISCVDDVVAAVRWRRSALDQPPIRESSTAGLDAVGRIIQSRNGILPQRGGLAGAVAAQYLVAVNGGGLHSKDFLGWRRRRGGSFTVDSTISQPIPVPVSGAIEGRTWLPFIDYRDIDELQRVVQAAAAVMICACTGMRGEECLRLPRGTLRKVPRPDGAYSYRIDGRVFKGVRDKNDQQDRVGKQWIWATIKPGAEAIAALEKLCDAAGSTELFYQPKSPFSELSTGLMTQWIQEFIDYSNALQRRLDVNPAQRISPDPAGRVTLDRFRRSIAWHIVNQPEGLLAAGVQFGHMQSTTTEGYASTITSGMAATMDHERTKALYSTLQANANAAKTGMRASGPAANKLADALGRFETGGFPGTYAEMSRRDERRLRSDPDLVVRENPGHGCLCLANPLKPETMACARENDGEPNRNDCKTYCGNRAYTDQTVSDDLAEVAKLRERIAEATPILASRIAKRINHLEQHIADHGRDALPLSGMMTDSGLPTVEKPAAQAAGEEF